jgi:hypothetical protein
MLLRVNISGQNFYYNSRAAIGSVFCVSEQDDYSAGREFTAETRSTPRKRLFIKQNSANSTPLR